MNKFKLSKIFIYPVKSMGGISIKTSLITNRGLQYDRRWLLVDKNNIFITKEYSQKWHYYLPQLKMV